MLTCRIEERFLALRKAFPPYMESIEVAQSVADRLDSPNVSDYIPLLVSDLPSQIVLECLLLRMCDQSYILRLHRPYQVMGYGNDEYRYSADRCVQAAKTILLDFHAAWLECPFLLNFCKLLCVDIARQLKSLRARPILCLRRWGRDL